MQDVDLQYRLTGKGWAECCLQIGDDHTTFTASYLSDPASEMILACIGLLKGSTEHRVSFIEEPGEFRLILLLTSPSKLHVQIVSFPDSHPHRPDQEGTEIFNSHCDLVRFARAVSRAFQSVLDQYGIDGYKERWSSYEFPLALLQSLKESIRSHATPTIST